MRFCFPLRLFPSLFALLFGALTTSPLAIAQRVFWAAAGTGDPADIQLVFENCTPSTPLDLPEIEDATFHFRGQSSQTQIVNFSRTNLLALNYRLQGISTRGQITIPSFTVQTDRGELSIPTYTTGTLQPGPEADIKARLATRKTTVWAGEVCPLVYSIDVARRHFSNFADTIQWDAAPLVAEDWGDPVATESMHDGELRLNINFPTRAYAKSPGPLRANPVRQLVNLNLGLTGGGFGLFQQQRIEQVTLTTNQAEIQVQPLPLPAPASYIGAVGSFTLESKVVPQTANVGEPITWTLTLSGTGNWPDIAGLRPRTVSADFQVLQPPAKRNLDDKKLFDGSLTEDVVLIPTRPGTYTLGAFEIHSFDPETGRYQSHRIAETTITVTAATATGTSTSIGASPTTGNDTSPPPNNEPETARSGLRPRLAAIIKESSTPPEGLIREPITANKIARLPVASLGQLAVRVAIPLAAVAAAWLGLALRRARLGDPLRPRRAALAQVPAALAALRESPSNAQALLTWQRLTARAHGLTHAAPAFHEFPDGEWRDLWAESERALYRETTPLPSDWIARAEAAHIALAKEIPGTAWASAFRKANLLPWLAALALSLALIPQSGRASNANTPNERVEDSALPINANQQAAAAYAIGAFPEAEALWRAAITAQPGNWSARHNLALALAQQDRWAEATAHATTAFVQNPKNEIVRWNLSIAQSKAGYSPAELTNALSDGPRARFAQLASPSGWECWAIGGASLTALALLLPLLRAYGLLRRSVKAPAIALGTLGLLLAALALFGRSHYGLAAHPHAALVWRAGTLYSIPTEADISQQTTPLSAGAIGVVEKTFLGWTQLRFSNGQTGWTRETELVPLWGAPPNN